MKQLRSTLAAAIVAATIASLSLSSSTLAAGWGDPVTIWGSNAETYGQFNTWPIGIVNAGGSTLVAAYTESVSATGAVDIYVLRSTNGGQDWLPRVRVSRPGSATRNSWGRTISANGNAVDLAWLEDSSNRGIRYARSLDGGATFSTSIPLSNGSAGYPDVARGPNGLVAVVWHTWTKGKLFVRVSHDGGATFDAKRALWTGLAHQNPNYSVAVGDGVIYAGIGLPGEGVLMRRSTDGVNWTNSKALTKAGPGELGFQLVAEGQQAYLGFTKPTTSGSAPWVRRTTNGGATWAAAVRVAPSAAGLQWPVMRLQDGTVRAIYSRCTTTTGPCTLDVYYQESSNGVSWTAPDPVGTAPAHYAIPMGVTHGDHTVIAYKYWAPINYNGDIQVRIGND